MRVFIGRYSERMRTAPEIALPLSLDGGESGSTVGGSLPARIAAELRRLIGETVLAPGDAVPSSRALAAHLGVSRGSVVAAYDQLLAEGYLSAAVGRSTVVNPQLRRVHPPPRPPRGIRHAPGIGRQIHHHPVGRLRRAARDALGHRRDEELGEVRHDLAGHVPDDARERIKKDLKKQGDSNPSDEDIYKAFVTHRTYYGY